MKCCVKSSLPPVCLDSYQTVHPNDSWDQFYANNNTCYQEVRARLTTEQGGLCAYCERRPPAGDHQVAHFHPKSDRSTARNWALEWSNLWFACSGGDQRQLEAHPASFREPVRENLSCDTAKRDEVLDGVIFAPHEIPAFPRLFRFEQYPDRMDIVPDEANCSQAGIDPGRVMRTIEKLNLNCLRLATARLAVHRVLQRKKREAMLRHADCSGAMRQLVMANLARSGDGSWKPFFTLVRWTLGSVAEKYLEDEHFTG